MSSIRDSHLVSLIQEDVSRRKNELQALSDSKMAVMTLRADTRLVDLQRSEARLGPKKEFLITSDERHIRPGGAGKGPYPLEFFLASLGFCEQTQYGRHSAAMDIPVDSVEMTLIGRFDRRGLYTVYLDNETDAAFKEIIVETKITGSVAEEKVERLVEAVHRTCPIYNTLKKAVNITVKVLYNGKPINSTKDN